MYTNQNVLFRGIMSHQLYIFMKEKEDNENRPNLRSSFLTSRFSPLHKHRKTGNAFEWNISYRVNTIIADYIFSDDLSVSLNINTDEHPRSITYQQLIYRQQKTR